MTALPVKMLIFCKILQKPPGRTTGPDPGPGELRDLALFQAWFSPTSQPAGRGEVGVGVYLSTMGGFKASHAPLRANFIEANGRDMPS